MQPIVCLQTFRVMVFETANDTSIH